MNCYCYPGNTNHIKKINQVKYKTEILILKQIFVTEHGAKIGYWRIKVVGTKMPLIWLF